MSNQSSEWQAMAKLVSQFYAKADAGEVDFSWLQNGSVALAAF
jgi:hypothetical protein